MNNCQCLCHRWNPNFCGLCFYGHIRVNRDRDWRATQERERKETHAEDFAAFGIVPVKDEVKR